MRLLHWIRCVINSIILKLKSLHVLSPSGDKLSTYAYRWTVLGVLIASVATCLAFWGIHIARSQFLTQLQELNAKAKIQLKGRFDTQTISIGPDVTSAIKLLIVPVNSGENNSSNWSAGLIFCKNVQIQGSDQGWKSADKNTFTFHSTLPVLKEQSFFNDLVDSIGAFDIILPGKKFYSWTNGQIPIATYVTYGEKSTQVNEIMFYDQEQKKVINKAFEVNDGGVITDLKGCYTVAGD